MQKAAKNLKSGEIIILNNKLMKVEGNPSLVQPGKGGSFAQVTLRDLKTNISRNERFKTDDNIEKAYLEKITTNFLFFDGENYVFLDNKTLEQYEVNKSLLSDHQKMFLFKEIEVELVLYEEKIISLQLPQKVSLQIIEKDPEIKKAQQNPSYKRAVLENQIEVKIPAYIQEGEYITIKTEDLSFVNRDNKKAQL